MESGPVEWSSDSGGRLDVVLAEHLAGVSRAQVARWVREGRVTVDGVGADKPGFRVVAGARVRVDVPPIAPATAIAQDLPIDVVFEDEHVAVINKHAGMVVHPAAGHRDGTLVNALLYHLDGLSAVGGQERPGLVHRLDKGTSGLLVVAKNDAAHRALAAQFADHSAGRTYLAWVLDPPGLDRGTVQNELGRHPRDRLRFTAVGAGQGRRAVTHWTVLGRAGAVGLVCCTLETGRTHQVRVHLSELGSPLVGDELYARRSASRVPARLRPLVAEDRPMLHAWRLQFVHPASGQRVQFVAEPPDDFAAIAAALELPLPDS